MNAVIRRILEAVRDRKVTRGTEALARGVLEAEDRRDVLAAAKACTTAKVAKQVTASVEHHEAFRAEQEREREDVSRETWEAVLDRSARDHRGHVACEACGKWHGRSVLEPHHLEMGSHGRRDAPEVVMALCSDCHRAGPAAAHRAVRWFAQNIVVPWLQKHGYPTPNRKEYR